MPFGPTWYFIGDASRARIFERATSLAALTLVDELDRPEARKRDRELGRDRPVRGRSRGAGEPFAIAETSLHDKAEAAFIENCADRLEEAASDGAFRKLVIVAPPKALGIMREMLGKAASQRLVATLDRDLTKTPAQDLPAYFAQHFDRG